MTDNTEDICEALVRHLESTGSDTLEKNFVKVTIKGAEIVCTVWCVIGKDAEGFALMAREWMDKNGYRLDK